MSLPGPEIALCTASMIVPAESLTQADSVPDSRGAAYLPE